jgi:hypothetical protein
LIAALSADNNIVMREITVSQAAKIIGVSRQMVLRYLRMPPAPVQPWPWVAPPRLVGRQMENGMWMIDEASARRFVRPKRGNPRFRKG